MSLTDQERIEMSADNCEVLRGRLAKYEDAEGNPISTIAELARDIASKQATINGMNEAHWKVVQELAALKDQPGGVVDSQRLLDWNRSQPEPRPIVVGREYQVAEACARLNSSPVSAGDKDGRAMAMLVAEAAYKAGNGLDRAVASNTLRQIVDGVFEQLGFAGVVDERAAFEAAYVAEFKRERNERFTVEMMVSMREGDHYGNRPYVNGQWKGWQARAALTASAPSHGEQVRVVVPEEWQTMLARVTDELDALNCAMRDQIDDDMAEPEEESELCNATDELIDEARALIAAAPSAGSQEQGE